MTFMRFPADNTLKNKLFDGRAHRITPLAIYRINETDFYYMSYFDNEYNNLTYTILLKTPVGFSNYPLVSYDGFNEFLNSVKITEVDVQSVLSSQMTPVIGVLGLETLDNLKALIQTEDKKETSEVTHTPSKEEVEKKDEESLGDIKIVAIPRQTSDGLILELYSYGTYSVLDSVKTYENMQPLKKFKLDSRSDIHSLIGLMNQGKKLRLGKNYYIDDMVLYSVSYSPNQISSDEYYTFENGGYKYVNDTAQADLENSPENEYLDDGELAHKTKMI